MRPGDYLAVSGLKGFGKSCLIAKTLKDDINLVAELFKVGILTNTSSQIKFINPLLS